MIEAPWRNALMMSTVLALLGTGCGSKNCDPCSEDATMDEVEDVTLEPEAVTDPDAPDMAEIDDPVEEDVEDEDDPDAPPGVDCSALDEFMTQEGLLVHLEAISTIATDNDGNRGAGSPGWDATIGYIEETLEGYGYATSRMDVEYSYYEETVDPVLEMVSPSTHTYVFTEDDPEGVTGDFQRLHLSRPGSVTARVTAVDLDLGPGNSSNSGCETEDFAGFTVGHIALVQRGACPYIDKALNAQAAGARAMVLFNQGNTTEREGLLPYGAIFIEMVPHFPEHGVNIPAVFASYTVGEGIATALASGPVELRVQVSDVFEVRDSQNLLAETATGDPDEVVIFGSHMDSDPGCHGMNDNATGIATLLEIARLTAECDPVRKIRFGFWAVEEWKRPWGSLQYVGGLSDTELSQILMYINLDMIGSPNHALLLPDGDGSEFFMEGPPGSAEIEAFYQADLLLRGYPTVPFWSSGSDHYGFVMAGIAYGGLWAGGGQHGDIKTDEEAAMFGGTAGELYDPCHHEPCDTMDNINLEVHELISKTTASAAQFFGVEGMSVPPLP